ncbi:ca2+modulated nonselective cation channel polycystin [Stemphylium lycopersici]|nr:ca2+modulated nonselective cation channel polycystin [Stemphylium lycopersici]
MCEEYTVIPTAATTSVIYRSDGYSPFPSNGVIPVSDVRLYDLYLPDSFPSATAIVTFAPNVTRVQTSATPFVYFTAYEVETSNKTETIQLPSAQAHPYWLRALEDKDTATGPLPQGFLEQVPHSACDIGQLQADVTVLIIVDLYYYNLPNLEPALIHFESSVLGFEDPPFVVNDWGVGISTAVPITVADWSIPMDPKPTAASFRPNHLPELVPTTRIRGVPMQPSVPQSHPPPVLTIGSSIITAQVTQNKADSGLTFVISGQTLLPGGAGVSFSGNSISLEPSGGVVVINGVSSTIKTQAVPASTPPAITVGNDVLSPLPDPPKFIIGGQTLSPGGPAITASGTTISLAPFASFFIANGATSVIADAMNPTITVGGSTFSPLPRSSAASFAAGGQILAPGSPAITISDTILSLGPSASFIIVNGATSTLELPTLPANPPSITIGNEIFSALPEFSETAFVLADQTLVAGGPEIVISGTTLSLASSASFVVVNGATSTLTNPAAPHITTPPLTIGGVVFRSLPGTGTAYLIGSVLLTAGGSIVVSGVTISLATRATALVINGQTSLISPQIQPAITNPPILTIGTETYTAMSGSGTTFVIGTEILTPGGTITFEGTTISLAVSATELIYGSSGRSTTTALFPATTTRSQSTAHTSGASTRAGGFNRQASATGQNEGAATLSLSSRHMCILLAIFAFLCSFLV